MRVGISSLNFNTLSSTWFFVVPLFFFIDVTVVWLSTNKSLVSSILYRWFDVQVINNVNYQTSVDQPQVRYGVRRTTVRWTGETWRKKSSNITRQTGITSDVWEVNTTSLFLFPTYKSFVFKLRTDEIKWPIHWNVYWEKLKSESKQ